MSRREDVVNDLWDRWHDLSDDAILLYLWSFTNPRCGMAGIYRCPRRVILEGRLGDGDRLDGALSELEAAGLVLYRDGVLLCLPRVGGLGTKTEQIAKSISKDLRNVDCPQLVARFAERYAEHEFGGLLRELPPDKGGLDLRNLKRTSTEPQDSAETSGSPNLTPNLTGTSVVGVGAGVGDEAQRRSKEQGEGEQLPTDEELARAMATIRSRPGGDS